MNRRGLIALILWSVLPLPPARSLLEADMTLHMLVQIPLLILCGAWLARWLPQSWLQAAATWNRQGIPGLLLFALGALIWMFPLSMDAALARAEIELLKFLAVPLLMGLPLGLSWPRAGFVVRGLFLIEMIATGFRAGWLYLVAPEALCANYLVGAQQFLGRTLIVLSAAATLLLALKLMWGHNRMEPAG